MDENLTPQDTLPDGGEFAPADGEGAVTPAEEVVNVKDLLGEQLGKTFDSDEAALKAVKDTFAYVGELGKYKKVVDDVRQAKGLANNEQAIKALMETIQNQAQEPQGAPAPATPAVDESKFVSAEQYQRDMFFAQHPELSAHRTVIELAQKATGKPINEVVEQPELKTLFEKAKGYDEVEKSKSVIMSNPRIGQVSDKIKQGQEAAKQGNYAEASKSAVGAVVDLIRASEGR